MYNALSFLAHILEFAVSFFFFKDIFETRNIFDNKNRYIPVSVSVTLYVIEYAIYTSFSSTLINIVVFFIVNYVIAFLFFNTNLFSSIASSVFLSASLTASELITMYVLSFGLKGNINAYKESLYVFSLLIIISRLMFFIITKLSEYAGFFSTRNKSNKLPVFLFLYPITTIVILYIFWIASTRYLLSRSISIAITVSSFLILISVFLTFVFYSRTSKKMNELYKEQSEAERVKTDTAYYSILDRQNETLKMLTHDEKNHLLAIKSIANNSDVDIYIDKLFGEIKESSLFGNTNNKYLDLLLNKYHSECESNQIVFDYSIKTANLSFMESYDLISMMSNILDNAVEAAKKSKDKKISLSINRNGSFDILACNNSCDSKPLSVGEELKSTKPKSGIHGYGFKSIKRTAKKYGGEVEWIFDESLKLFNITMVFPHKEQT